jgi:CDP-glucose 4,6-dehydratase
MSNRLFPSYRGKRVLVTGCTGFKGSWLCVWLKALGAEVSGLALAPATTPNMFDAIGINAQMDFHQGDITDRAFVAAVLARVQPDVVFHLAAQAIVKTSYEDPVGTFATNVMGSIHVLDGLRTLKKPVRAIMITSDKCYENVEWVFGYKETDALGGKDPYSASKAGAEVAIRAYAQSYFSGADSLVQVISVRAGNVIGGGDWADARIVPDCVRAWSQGAPVRIRNPKATRPWQHVLEPLSGYLLAGEALASKAASLHGEAFNFGPAAEQNHSVYELLIALAKRWAAQKSSSFEVDNFVGIEPAPFHEAGLLKLNCDKALYHLQWRPTLDFAATAAFTADWYAHFYANADAADSAASADALWQYTQMQLQQYICAAAKRGLPWARSDHADASD